MYSTFVVDDDLSWLIEDTIKLGEDRYDEVFGGLAVSSLVFEKESKDAAFVSKCAFD